MARYMTDRSATNRRVDVGRLIIRAIACADTAGLDEGGTAETVINHLAAHGHLPVEWSTALAVVCTHCGAEAYEPCVNPVPPDSFEADEFGARWATTTPHDARLTPRLTVAQALRDSSDAERSDGSTPPLPRVWHRVDEYGYPTGTVCKTSNPDGPTSSRGLRGNRWVLGSPPGNSGVPTYGVVDSTLEGEGKDA